MNYEQICINALKNAEKHLTFINSLSPVIVELNSISTENGLNSIESKQIQLILYFNFFITFSLKDSTVLLLNFERDLTPSELDYFSRLSHLTTYEFFKSYNNYKNDLKDISFLELNSKQEFIDINKEIKLFKNTFKYDSTINQIRNKTIGHFDKDFNLFNSTLSSIDFDESQLMLYELMLIINKLFELSNSCFDNVHPGEDFDEEKHSVNSITKKLDELRNELLKKK